VTSWESRRHVADVGGEFLVWEDGVPQLSQAMQFRRR
jgi:hypothetical protein